MQRELLLFRFNEDMMMASKIFTRPDVCVCVCVLEIVLFFNLLNIIIVGYGNVETGCKKDSGQSGKVKNLCL